jgi:hypothetical protein
VVALVNKDDEVIEWTLRANKPFQASVEVTRTSTTVPNSVNVLERSVDGDVVLAKPT